MPAPARVRNGIASAMCATSAKFTEADISLLGKVLQLPRDKRLGLRQFDAMRLADKQPCVEITFDGPDQSAERQLLDPQPGRSARGMPFLCDRDEIEKLTQFHAIPR
jgi:hypothetical protein